MSPSEDSYGTLKRLNFISEVIRQINPATVLDIGCGVGQVAYPLAQEFSNTTFRGVDNDKASIEHARAIHAAPNLEFREFREESAQDKYDVIIASEVIEHVEEPDEFLSLLRDKLNDTGRLVLTLPNGYGPFEFAAVTEALLKATGVYSLLRRLKNGMSANREATPVQPVTLAQSPHINFFSYSTIMRILSKNGFAVEQYRPRTFLCGFGFDQILRSQRLLRWNSRVADRLPPFASSDWMFLARPTVADCHKKPYKRGLFARSRRHLYEKQCGLR